MSDTLSHISMVAWGDIKESDYTVEQWHRACLIHQHQGPPTSKAQCKLPVRTPTGALNRHGVHAAAAALAGARGGVNASRAEKEAAAKALVSHYKELDEQLPKTLVEHSAGKAFTSEFLAHFGVKGMKWGRRRDKGNSALDESNSSEDARTAREITTKVSKGGVQALSNKELRHLVDRIKLETQFAEVASATARKQNPMKAGASYVAKKISKTGDMAVNAVLQTAVNIKVQEEFAKKMRNTA